MILRWVVSSGPLGYESYIVDRTVVCSRVFLDPRVLIEEVVIQIEYKLRIRNRIQIFIEERNSSEPLFSDGVACLPDASTTIMMIRTSLNADIFDLICILVNISFPCIKSPILTMIDKIDSK